MRRRFHLGCWLLLLHLLTATPATIIGQTADEYEVKAAFLFNFTRFIEFPLIDKNPFSICIFGDDPFGSTIDRLVKGKITSGRLLEVRRLKGTTDAQRCSIVFVRRGEEGRAAKLIEAVHGFPVLTVGESQDFGTMGGLSYLAMEEDRVKVFINANAARAAGLIISAKLLSLASIIKTEPRLEK